MKTDYTRRQSKERLRLLPPAGAEHGMPAQLIAQLCAARDHRKNSAPQNLLVSCLSGLSASAAARTMIREAAQDGWKLALASCGHDFHLDVPEKQILLDDYGLHPEAFARSPYFRNLLTVSLIRALRDVWQEKRHGGFDEHYGPEAILMLERVRAADCDVLTLLTAWELREGGHNGLWRHLLGAGEADMAAVFAARLERDLSSLQTGTALAAAFSQWYRNPERVNACDHETLEYIDTVLRENGGGNPFGRREITPAAVEILSCLPDKTAYLRSMGRAILTDPLYSGMGDMVNQTHFLQIRHDLQVVYVQDVPFRDAALAGKIFPGGLFTNDVSRYQETS